MDFLKVATVVLVLLVIFGGVTLWKLLATKEPAKDRVVAKRALQAFTLLKDADLGASSGSTASEEVKQEIRDLTDRYLLVNVKQGAEVKGEMAASKAATPLLSNSVAVSVPASVATSLGGQLRVGELVDLVAVPKQGTGVRKFENLVVLNIVINKDANVSSAITLAVPSSQRDDFALAVTGAELLVTRKLVAPN